MDAVEENTGLPTLGIRETSATVRVRPGDAVLVAGLDTDLQFDTRRRISPLARIPLLGPLFGARRENRSRTALIVLVTAQKV